MKTRYFALGIGIFLLLSALIGYIPGLHTPIAPDAPNVVVETPIYGYLLGAFPNNVIFNIVRLVAGVLGIAAFTNYGAARTYSRGLAIAYILFAVMGLIPGLNTTFGLLPLYGGNIWLHLLSGLAAAYFGFFVDEPREEQGVPFEQTRQS